MPTSHPRIGLVRDPLVDEALRTARDAMGSTAPDAALARELLLLGADQAIVGRLPPRVRRLVEDRGARPAALTCRAMLAQLGTPPPSDGPPLRLGTEALEDQRRERLG